jgi:hypothetical protein
MTGDALPRRRDVIKRFRRPETPRQRRRRFLRDGGVLTLGGSLGLALGWGGWSWWIFFTAGLLNLAFAWFLFQRRPLD